MKLLRVQDTPAAPELLYQLLQERAPATNISHREMPTWDAHTHFIQSRPYKAWYVIQGDGSPVGSIYLSKINEIGVFILIKHQGQGFGKLAIQMLMEKHPGERFLANINPNNSRSIKFFKSLGFKHIQNTYEKR